MNCENQETLCPAKILSGDCISESGVFRIDATSSSEIFVTPGTRAHIFDATAGVKNFSRRILL